MPPRRRRVWSRSQHPISGRTGSQASIGGERYGRRSAPPVSPAASTFVFRKPREIGEAEAGELVPILFAPFASPLKMTLEQAATIVGNIDTITGRAKDGPGRFDRRPQDNSVDHSQRSEHRHVSRWQLAEVRNVSTFSRATAPSELTQRNRGADMLHHGKGLPISPCTRRRSPRCIG